ncbi:hypothetical protein AMTR_s00042p00081680 [Amborella trichopoda]|uniref:Uncharacterized protein n=1 Tax=Amborella trichopoda TaxID=13333 RepID=W1P6L4_AMBTC|nr:hypothetical protein AMTR_s00042p00081680 [Amborella trichopoda]
MGVGSSGLWGWFKEVPSTHRHDRDSLRHHDIVLDRLWSYARDHRVIHATTHGLVDRSHVGAWGATRSCAKSAPAMVPNSGHTVDHYGACLLVWTGSRGHLSSVAPPACKNAWGM